MEENTTTVPAFKEWPGAFGLFKVSREGVRKNIGTLLILIIGLYVISIILSLILSRSMGKIAADVVNQIVSWALSTVFSIAFVRVVLASARQERIELDASLQLTGKLFWKMVLLELLLLFSVLGGLILLIVPGIIIGCRLSLAQYYLVDRDYDVMEAYKASWHATDGHLGKVLGIAGVTLLMLLPTLTIIGVIATAYLLFMYSAAAALLYLFLSKKKTKKAAV